MSNWEKLQQKLTTVAALSGKKRKPQVADVAPHSSSFKAKKSDANKGGVGDISSATDNDSVMAILDARAAKIPQHVRDKYVGLDCEMVGIGPSGKCSVLARCCMTSFTGEVIYDEFVRPSDYVTDFRTEYSGVRKRDMRTGNAISLAQCQQDVARILKGKILVGHALHNDLKVLLLSHPHTHIRDTARYKFYMRPHGKKGGKFKPRALRDITKQHLKLVIQQGEHDPSIDARCAMNLYRAQMSEWESALRAKKMGKSVAVAPGATVSDSNKNITKNDNDSDSGSDSEEDEEDEEEEEAEEEGHAEAVTEKGDFIRSKKQRR